MRRQAMRYSRIDRQPYLNKPIGTRSIVAAYTLMLLVPVFLWAFSNPLLAAGVVALIGGTYTVGRVGIRAYRRLGRRMLERLLMTTRDVNQ